MSTKHPKTCEYCGAELDTYTVDHTLYCDSCGKAVAVTCPACGGDGVVQEDEYEGDWVNCTDELITCPECNGYGWTADPSFQ
jgi:hypothetical protein